MDKFSQMCADVFHFLVGVRVGVRNAVDDLDVHKKDLVVRSRRSVGREDTSSIKAEDYKLKFEKSSAEGEHTLDLVAAFPKAEPARERLDPVPVQPPVEPDP